MTVIWKPELEIKMTGKEEYPVKDADLIPRRVIDKITSQFKGLARYAECLEKNRIAQEELGGFLVLGKIAIISAKDNGCFWMDYNPPLEFHAWLVFNTMIFDFALPGMIERGGRIKDSLGPFVEGRDPFILIGEPPEWIYYEAKEIFR